HEKATETLEIYSPLANRLGVHRLKWELEDLSFQALHPKRFEEIKSLVEKREGERAEYIDLVTEHLRSRFRELKIKAEVRGRPQQMNRTAEYGIAAHWRYKEGPAGSAKKAADEQAENLAWLGRMLEWQKEMADPKEFMEGLKIDLYEGRVFVFTPKGDVIDLPAGSTPLDIAYAVHTEVGHRCVGARVSGR